jgi:hypothetical protein
MDEFAPTVGEWARNAAAQAGDIANKQGERTVRLTRRVFNGHEDKRFRDKIAELKKLNEQKVADVLEFFKTLRKGEEASSPLRTPPGVCRDRIRYL